MSLQQRGVVLGGFLVVSGCLYFGVGDDHGSTTRTHAAEVSSATPPLAAFVLRVSIAQLALDNSQTAIAESAALDNERAIGPLDAARTLLVDELIHDLEQHHFESARISAAVDRVVEASDAAAPRVDDALRRAHASLLPWQRVILGAEVSRRLSGWSTSWDGGNAANHVWLGSVETNALADRATLDADAHATTQHWTNGLVAQVAATADATSFDETERAALVTRLRAQVHE